MAPISAAVFDGSFGSYGWVADAKDGPVPDVKAYGEATLGTRVVK